MIDQEHGPYLRHAGTILALAEVFRGTEHPNGRKEDVATHTLMVVALTLDLAMMLYLDNQETLVATRAALCHDYAETIAGEIDTLVPLTPAAQLDKEAAEAQASQRLRQEKAVGHLLNRDFEPHWLVEYADKLCPILVSTLDDARRLHQRGINSDWLCARKIDQFDAMTIPGEHRERLRLIWDNAVDDLCDRLDRRQNYNVDGDGEG